MLPNRSRTTGSTDSPRVKRTGALPVPYCTRSVCSERIASAEIHDAGDTRFQRYRGSKRRPDGLMGERIHAVKTLAHPDQIEIANQVFSPSPEEVARARKLDAIYKEAQEKGLGAVAFEGKLVDVAVIRNARSIIQQADLIGM